MYEWNACPIKDEEGLTCGEKIEHTITESINILGSMVDVKVSVCGKHMKAAQEQMEVTRKREE